MAIHMQRMARRQPSSIQRNWPPTLKGDMWANVQGKRQVSSSNKTCARWMGGAQQATSAGRCYSSPAAQAQAVGLQPANPQATLPSYQAKAVHVAGCRRAAARKHLRGLQVG